MDGDFDSPLPGNGGCATMVAYTLFFIMFFSSPHRLRIIALLPPLLIFGMYLIWLFVVLLADVSDSMNEKPKAAALLALTRSLKLFFIRCGVILILIAPIGLVAYLWR